MLGGGCVDASVGFAPSMRPPVSNTPNTGPQHGPSRIGGFIVTMVMGLAGLLTAGLIVYQILRALLSAVFGVELPNPF